MRKPELTPFQYKLLIENAFIQLSKLESYLSLLLEVEKENDEANLIAVALDITLNIKEEPGHE